MFVLQNVLNISIRNLIALNFEEKCTLFFRRVKMTNKLYLLLLLANYNKNVEKKALCFLLAELLEVKYFKNVNLINLYDTCYKNIILINNM